MTRLEGFLLFVLAAPSLPAQCTFTISPAAAPVTAAGGTGTITITGPSTCQRTVTSNADWLTVTFGNTGTGNGTAGWSAARNTYAVARTGTLTVAGQTFTVTQDAAVCDFTLLPDSMAFDATGGTGAFTVKTLCSWTPVPNAAWITIDSVTANGDVHFTVAQNTATIARTGLIQVGTKAFTVTQAARQVPDCSTFAFNPATGSLPAAGGTATVNVNGMDPRCNWVPVSDSAWLTIADPTRLRSGSGPIDFSAPANTQTSSRTANITVGSKKLPVTQNGAAAPVSLTALTNAANYVEGAVSPGEIVTLFGTGLGPDRLAPPQLTSDGAALTTTLAGTRVLFDGTPAPMVYTYATQASAIVPYGVEGRLNTQVQVEYLGNRSALMTLSVVAAVPGIFTLAQTGAGQGAILNQDYTVNGSANPAPKGSVVMVYCTGGGQTNPPGTDGAIATAAAELRMPPTARVGNVDAPVTYAGAAPNLVNGAVQVNVRIPPDAPTGDAVPLVVRFGNYGSQPGVTLAVRE